MIILPKVNIWLVNGRWKIRTFRRLVALMPKVNRRGLGRLCIGYVFYAFDFPFISDIQILGFVAFLMHRRPSHVTWLKDTVAIERFLVFRVLLETNQKCACWNSAIVTPLQDGFTVPQQCISSGGGVNDEEKSAEEEADYLSEILNLICQDHSTHPIQ